MNSVIGYYTTQFGELWEKSLFDLVEEAIVGVLKEGSLAKEEIDVVFFGNMLAGTLENNLHSPSKIAEILKMNIPIFRVEAACASGGVAFNLAKTYLEANSNKNVLVIGAEKMKAEETGSNKETSRCPYFDQPMYCKGLTPDGKPMCD